MESENKTQLDIAHKTIDALGFFKEDGNFTYIYKKTEKLATAVYMVTNLFSDNEPMKWTLRKKVSDMLLFVIDYKDTFSSRKIDFLYQMKSNVLEVTSLLEISLRAGLVSQMNFSIIRQEFLNLIATIDMPAVMNKEVARDTLSSSFFDVPVVPTARIHTKSDVLEGQNPIKDRVSITDKKVQRRSNRQTTILSILAKKGDLTIKDISHVIKDCSEKTIQRELNSFMSAGLVKRTGERRWSRYSLV